VPDVLDELMRAGWPALEEVTVDGWVARFSGGVTQRANSVLSFREPADVDSALDTVEALYEERGLRPLFQVGPHIAPAGLDDLLARRGYVFGSPTSVFTAEVGERPPVDVEVSEVPSADWLGLWWAVDGRGDDTALAIAVKILTGGPALYATTRDEAGRTTAVARLALVGEWGGLYCMAVRDDARGRGLGARLLDGVLLAGHERGVRRAWLQVRAENDGARRLYQRAGFTEVARYHYRSHGG
jgi:N-acetylglutamate synthase